MKQYLDNSILDSLLEGFQLIDFSWRYIYVNETVAKQGRSTKNDLLGQTMMEKYPGIEKTEMFSSLQECMKERISKRIENEFYYQDGTKGWFELHIEPVSEGLFILSMDISERKRAEEALKKLNDLLENKVKERTIELESKNKDITDSIQYAYRIQKARLPDKKDIHSVFPDSFILYQPKDIVSGDFYFFKKRNDEILMASADCTGHGVPGALMSMLCSEKLNYAASEFHHTPDILTYLNNEVKTSLYQTYTHDAVHDGMDIALCSYHTVTRKLKYSGANRPIWLVRGGDSEILEIKGTKNSIGGYTNSIYPFEHHEIQLFPGDTFYIFSDGYTDMFGGEWGKKLTTRKFKQLLSGIQHLSMDEQGKYLENFAEKWKGSLQQIDDILVIGVRITN